MALCIDEMRAHVILDHLGHEPCHSPSHSGDEMHDLFTVRLVVERALDSFDLTFDAAHARQQLLLFTDRVSMLLIL
jgi:hypothetical protein